MISQSMPIYITGTDPYRGSPFYIIDLLASLVIEKESFIKPDLGPDSSRSEDPLEKSVPIR
jgi:hypothetical protein